MQCISLTANTLSSREKRVIDTLENLPAEQWVDLRWIAKQTHTQISYVSSIIKRFKAFFQRCYTYRDGYYVSQVRRILPLPNTA